MTDVTVSRLGQVNLSGEDNALFQQIFAGEILTTFNQECVYQDKHVIREIPNGKSAEFPATGTIKAGYHKPGTMLQGTPIAHNKRVIVIDDLLVADTYIANIDEAKNHYDVRAEYSKQIGQALALAFDRNVARVGVLAARDAATLTGGFGGSQIVGGANIKTDGVAIGKAMFAAAQVLDEKNVPSADRYAFMSPATYYAAAAEKTLINKDWNGAGSLAAGTIDTVAGIKIVKTNSLPATDETGDNEIPQKYRGDFSKTAFSVFHRSAVGTARLLNLAMDQQYLATHQATLLVAKYALGHGILRPECAIEVTE